MLTPLHGIQHLQPFSIVDDVGFQSLLNITEPRYKIPSRSTFSRKMIPKMYEDLKEQYDKRNNKIKNMMSNDIEEGKLYLYKLHLFYRVILCILLTHFYHNRKQSTISIYDRWMDIAYS